MSSAFNAVIVKFAALKTWLIPNSFFIFIFPNHKRHIVQGSTPDMAIASRRSPPGKVDALIIYCSLNPKSAVAASISLDESAWRINITDL